MVVTMLDWLSSSRHATNDQSDDAIILYIHGILSTLMISINDQQRE